VRAAVYCRISQDRNGEGLGVERQREDCEALAERNGWELGDVYTDNDLSAYTGKRRPEYARLCADIEAGTVDVVLAWDPDRLHRSPSELETFIDLIESSGARVATVNSGEVDLSSASGRMTARVVGAVARHESEHKSERLRRKHVELAENGKVSGGGRRPFEISGKSSADGGAPAQAGRSRVG
jgi:DNA invertase Pin-like site-specific DNA recombinase